MGDGALIQVQYTHITQDLVLPPSRLRIVVVAHYAESLSGSIHETRTPLEQQLVSWGGGSVAARMDIARKGGEGFRSGRLDKARMGGYKEPVATLRETCLVSTSFFLVPPSARCQTEAHRALSVGPLQPSPCHYRPADVHMSDGV